MYCRPFALAAVVLSSLVALAQATPVATGNITYSGIEGPFNSSGLAGTVPANLALNPLNSPTLPQAFASADIASGGIPYHQIVHLNDGSYGNSRSWIGGFGGENNTSINVTGVGPVNATFAGINLLTLDHVTSFAFGSDNGNYLSGQTDPNVPSNTGDPNENAVGPDTGFYHDRTGGTYYVQYTTAASPNALTPDASWNTLGSITLLDGTNDAYRHVYDLTTPVLATGLRIIVPGGNRLDEIEIYGQQTPEPSTFVLGGLALLGLLFVRRNRTAN